MSSKFNQVAAEKLINNLYHKTLQQAKLKVPHVTNFLYRNPPSSGSSLDDLVANQWKLKQLEQAPLDLPDLQITKIKSNILIWNNPNSLLVNTDFYNAYPVQRDAQYQLPPDAKGIDFWAVKARNPITLSFYNQYVLVFPSHDLAAAYWMETRNKTLNGLPMNLKFVEPSKRLLSHITSPLFGKASTSNSGIPEPKAAVEEVFAKSPEKMQLITSILQNPSNNFANISQLIDFNSRLNMVLVRNLPIGLSKHALPRLLWNYEFPSDIPLDNCFIEVVRDGFSSVNRTLIKFANHENARRFVRSYNGTKWQGRIQDKRKVIQSHEPILCEILY
ncbi:hypothetical protein PSN45_005074 [Yamadazyma tenuis]|uniref:RRM domain-containing protein n=1 Tax=Candida tenuis (strain ATCC 10573 / BCRC 21748 / CBS 615 / JCM 9827 / NBRC 10315 / NRRL Y-1498 / VKM Y-70) TaxID=590646 RepID=G3B2Q0_CANTC|nr:uncharacterized protein CANTEDRAFT_113511 [Yamadazyma tenuis ATCC 10573]XP_006685922.1 uncharacterized protein CANTEDRAFT_113511 [Yamadazyma tenuis ATCC 10573]EGV65115.1 hypothetical protein CANTEDRAFT_113511 [Yamadazyma tenuis ATCC 10573]EGV65116.1 hypothetical protein CANTEDRAFT_113511 [Yamadazyma tenuis ATCC 10573]WEJ97521.1 hypothetical protein PSN45_005074 [Yamadazyma tenuis]